MKLADYAVYILVWAKYGREVGRKFGSEIGVRHAAPRTCEVSAADRPPAGRS